MRRRVYGADHDDPGPQPGHSYRELAAGPLDGLLLDVTSWTEEQLHEGAALVTEIGSYGAGGRAGPVRAPERRSQGVGVARRHALSPWATPGLHAFTSATVGAYSASPSAFFAACLSAISAARRCVPVCSVQNGSA